MICIPNSKINGELSCLLLLGQALASLAPIPAGLPLYPLQNANKRLHHILLLGSLGYSKESCHVVLQFLILEVESVIGVHDVVDGICVSAEDDGVCMEWLLHREELRLLGFCEELDFFRWLRTDLLAMDSLFWHSMHLQESVQCTPSWKHSQYFFTQKDLRHEQPLPYLPPSNLTILSAAPVAMPAYIFAKSLPFWLRQSMHLQFLLHSCPAEKHSQ